MTFIWRQCTASSPCFRIFVSRQFPFAPKSMAWQLSSTRVSRFRSFETLCSADVRQLKTHALSNPQAARNSKPLASFVGLAQVSSYVSSKLPHLAKGRAQALPKAELMPTVTALQEFISQGPLLASCGVALDSIAQDMDRWLALGLRLAEQLKLDHDNLDEIQRKRLYHYYLPVYFWCLDQLAQHRVLHKDSPTIPALVIAISAPQGCGKSTLVEQLEGLLAWEGKRAAVVSIDDFYLSYEDQGALGKAHPDNRLLQLRGNAGTHDLALGVSTLQTLTTLSPGQTAKVPRYDKSAYDGRGDRASPDTWPEVTGPLDIVMFEGWMSGFTSVGDPQILASVDPALKQVDSFLGAYREKWDSLVDSWLVVRIGDPAWVFSWRKQAEDAMKAAGRPGMTDKQLEDFVSRFMPAYQAYLPGLYSHGPSTARHGHTLVLEVDEDRLPVEEQPPCVV